MCLAVLSFEEQIKIDLATDIMVGPHGAGLMHNIFMRDRAALIEVDQPDLTFMEIILNSLVSYSCSWTARQLTGRLHALFYPSLT